MHMKISFVSAKAFIVTKYTLLIMKRKSLAGEMKPWVKKTLFPFMSSRSRRLLHLFAENIYGIWLLRKWASRAGYVFLFLVSFALIIIADNFESTQYLIHATNANEAVIGSFTILLALLIPLAIALIQGDSSTALARQTMVKTIIRFGTASYILVFICIFLFIPSGVRVAGNGLTIKNLYASVLVCCVVFILASFYRSIRWLSDESSYSSGNNIDGSSENDLTVGFSSYRFAWIVRLLKGARGFQTWMAIWSQRFPVGYEETIHQAFFDRVSEVVDKRRSKQYASTSLELESYDKNFEKRNQYSVKFEYDNPERFFNLHGKINRILEEDRINSRMAGLWRGENATKNISIKYIEALMIRQRVWSLFEAMEKYLKSNNLIALSGDKIRDDIILKHFITAVFEAIKSDKISTHDASEHFSKTDSVWTVTYDHLYDMDKRLNLSFLVQEAYYEWIKSLLDQRKDKEYYIENDSIVNMVFPGTDPITMGKLYWLLYLGSSSNYLELYIKEFRPIGLMGSMSETGFYASDRKDAMKEFTKDTRNQVHNSIKLFCNLYWRYLRTDFFKLSDNLKTAKNMDRSLLSEVEAYRLDDFINIAELILKFYEESNNTSKKSIKKKKL